MSQAQDLRQFLSAITTTADFSGDIDLHWDKCKRTFTLSITFYAANPTNEAIVDAQGVKSDLGVIEFCVEILIYDKDKPILTINNDDYLALIAFNGKKGWSKPYAQAFAVCFNEFLLNGQQKLNTFLTSSDAAVFELKFSTEKIATAAAKLPLCSERIKYPRFQKE